MNRWHFDALSAVRKLTEEREVFTSDDVYELAGDPPDPNHVGALFREAKQIGLIAETGRSVRSKRPASKGRRILEWTAAISNQGALAI